MISVFIPVSNAERDLVIARLWEAGTTGIIEEPGGLRAFFDTASPAFTEFQEEPDRDWERETREAWPARAVGERFYLVPEWSDEPAPAGRLRLVTHPGMACGTGEAPATQLALRLMERWVRPAMTFLDLGTGSGILADAALLLGATRVYACDIDPAASAIAHRNVPGALTFTGSVRSLRIGCVDTVVANLNAATLRANAAEIQRVLRPGGLLILSGFRADEAAGVADSLEMKPRDRLQEDIWCSLVL